MSSLTNSNKPMMSASGNNWHFRYSYSNLPNMFCSSGLIDNGLLHNNSYSFHPQMLTRQPSLLASSHGFLAYPKDFEPFPHAVTEWRENPLFVGNHRGSRLGGPQYLNNATSCLCIHSSLPYHQANNQNNVKYVNLDSKDKKARNLKNKRMRNHTLAVDISQELKKLNPVIKSMSLNARNFKSVMGTHSNNSGKSGSHHFSSHSQHPKKTAVLRSRSQNNNNNNNNNNYYPPEQQSKPSRKEVTKNVKNQNYENISSRRSVAAAAAAAAAAMPDLSDNNGYNNETIVSYLTLLVNYLCRFSSNSSGDSGIQTISTRGSHPRLTPRNSSRVLPVLPSSSANDVRWPPKSLPESPVSSSTNSSQGNVSKSKRVLPSPPLPWSPSSHARLHPTGNHNKIAAFLKSVKIRSGHKGRQSVASRSQVFGRNLEDLLRATRTEVPRVLEVCAKFIELHGITDGIYRISGITSNIKKLRSLFEANNNEDGFQLEEDWIMQDIHCVSSLVKLFFRELPQPLLSENIQLYLRKAAAERKKNSDSRESLDYFRQAIYKLPRSHYNTLKFLMLHLKLISEKSNMTEMNSKNLAIVWAPNLIRSSINTSVDQVVEDDKLPKVNMQMKLQLNLVQNTQIVEYIIENAHWLFESSDTKCELKLDCSNANNAMANKSKLLKETIVQNHQRTNSLTSKFLREKFLREKNQTNTPLKTSPIGMTSNNVTSIFSNGINSKGQFERTISYDADDSNLLSPSQCFSLPPNSPSAENEI